MKNIKSEKNYNSLSLFAALLLVLLMPSQTKADVYDYEYSLGVAFTTTKILGDNPAINTLRPINSSIPGGSFNGAMPGIEIVGQYKLDEVGDWRLVGGVNYTIYSAREKFPGDISIFKFSHSLNVLSPLVGINYTLFRFPTAMSSFYAGVEMRYNYIHGSELILNENSRANDELLSQRSISKESAGRMGGLVKLGIEGEVHENYMINVSWGLDVLNAVGRDNNRGQLLTPYSKEVLIPGFGYELEEELTYNFYFSLMIQYRFD